MWSICPIARRDIVAPTSLLPPAALSPLPRPQFRVCMDSVRVEGGDEEEEGDGIAPCRGSADLSSDIMGIYHCGACVHLMWSRRERCAVCT